MMGLKRIVLNLVVGFMLLWGVLELGTAVFTAEHFQRIVGGAFFLYGIYWVHRIGNAIVQLALGYAPISRKAVRTAPQVKKQKAPVAKTARTKQAEPKAESDTVVPMHSRRRRAEAKYPTKKSLFDQLRKTNEK